VSIIQVNNLTFAYEGSYDNIFKDVSFRIDTDWRLGFIGRNGRGKTTMLKLFTGAYEYGGSITASVAFEYFPFPVADESLSVLEVSRAINDSPNWQLERELSLLDIPLEILQRPYATLSHGERTKVLLAALFIKDDLFLLIDEPTDHLDAPARALVARYLQSKKGFILVSHDRKFLDACIDHVLSINRGGIEVQAGNFSSWFRNRQQQDNFELEQNRRLKKEIKRLETTSREKARWSDKVESTKIGSHSADRGRIGHLAAKAMKRSKSIETRVERELEEKSKSLKNIEKVDALTLSPLTHHSQRLLALEDVSVFYGENKICENVSFYVERGERAALQGKNGSGKSSLLRLCLQAAGAAFQTAPPNGTSASQVFKPVSDNIRFTGEIRAASGLIISFVSQDSKHLTGNLSDYAQKNRLDESLFKAILRKLEFSRIQFDKDMEDFSSGQKKKVLIAQSLCERAHIYIWDEPLNFIDVLSRMQIEELILSGSARNAMLFVEHDGAFVEKIATKTIRL
jgi:lincosamide and streptogramin A transport system ATP-binding/permease protein